MRKTWIGAVALLASAGAATAQTGYGQITLQNNTSVTLDLYVDADYGCRALPNLACTTSATAGEHNLTAQSTDGRSVVYPGVVVESGGSYTWTVSEGGDGSGSLK